MIDDAVVPILAAEANIPLDGEGFETALGEPHQRHVEGAAAQVIDEHSALLRRQRAVQALFQRGRDVERICQGRGGRLIEDVEHFEAGDASGVFGRLAARLVEVRRHRDDRLVHRADAVLGVLHQLAKNDGGQGLGAELAAGHFLPERRVPHVALDEHGDAVGLFEGDVARRLPHHRRAVLQEHGARRQHLAFEVGQRDRLTAIVERRNGRERRAQINPDQLAGGNCHGTSANRVERCRCFEL